MTNAHPQPSTSHPFDERCVLNGRPVRPETELSRASRFVDDVWDLSPAFHWQGWCIRGCECRRSGSAVGGVVCPLAVRLEGVFGDGMSVEP